MTDYNINLNIPALEQLLKTTVSGIGAVGGPILARWTARAEADALRIKAQGQADSMRLIAAAQSEAQKSLGPTSSHGEIDIQSEVQARLSFQEEKRQANIESVVREAAAELGEKQVPNQDVDHDWTARFFADVQDVSSEKMQQIWANILAGEVETPGRTSMRTLSILRNMSQRNAELFESVAPFILGDFVLNDPSVEGISGFPRYSDFLELSHHDLIHTEPLGLDFAESEHRVRDHDVVYRITEYNPGTNKFAMFKFPCYILTPSGRELYTFIKCRKNEDYLSVLAAFLKQRGGGKLSYARILNQVSPDKTSLEEWRYIAPRAPRNPV